MLGEDSFPENYLRGISQKVWIHDDLSISAAAFYPDKATAENRADKGHELSINWEDDDTVVEFTRNQRNEQNNLVFAHGVARLARRDIDHLNTIPHIGNALNYEREPVRGGIPNPYHGNVVFRHNLTKHELNGIASFLAISAILVR